MQGLDKFRDKIKLNYQRNLSPHSHLGTNLLLGCQLYFVGKFGLLRAGNVFDNSFVGNLIPHKDARSQWNLFSMRWNLLSTMTNWKTIYRSEMNNACSITHDFEFFRR